MTIEINEKYKDSFLLYIKSENPLLICPFSSPKYFPGCSICERLTFSNGECPCIYYSSLTFNELGLKNTSPETADMIYREIETQIAEEFRSFAKQLDIKWIKNINSLRERVSWNT
jgi:hypothetical protein